MTVPKIFSSFGLAQDITHHSPVRILKSGTETGPGAQVGEVEGDVVCFGERVKVDVVEAEQVVRTKGTESRHTELQREDRAIYCCEICTPITVMSLAAVVGDR